MSTKPTPALELQITAFIRAGGYPHVAAEAAGVPRRIFERWLRYGSKSRHLAIYGAFAKAIRQAAAQARLRAEIAVLESKPLDWLKFGPGKETGDNPGWTATVKALTARSKRDANALEDPTVRALLAALPQVLAPFPEARDAVVQCMTEVRRLRRRRSGS
jgi:hypothetical protein